LQLLARAILQRVTSLPVLKTHNAEKKADAWSEIKEASCVKWDETLGHW